MSEEGGDNTGEFIAMELLPDGVKDTGLLNISAYGERVDTSKRGTEVFANEDE